jgi:E3 ubiquitin ligase
LIQGASSGKRRYAMICTLLLRPQNSPAPLAMWSVVGLCAGIYLFIRGFGLLQRRHLILDTPVSKIRSASLGMVELNGLADGPHTVVAPITARACYYYRTVAWEWKQEGKSKKWEKVAAESMHVPFFLDDNTGKVMVDPRGADLDLHRDFFSEFCDGFFTTKDEAPPNVRDFLLRHGVSTRNKIKVEEFCIKPKNSLFVLGTLDENPGLELTPQPIIDEEHNTFSLGARLGFDTGVPGFSRPDLLLGLGRDDKIEQRLASKMAAAIPASFEPKLAKEVIQLSPNSPPSKAVEMSQQQKIAAAMLRAGITNPAAWAAAGVTPAMAEGGVHAQAASAVSASANLNSNLHSQTDSSSIPSPSASAGNGGTAAPGFDARPPVVLMKGKNAPTFLISWRSQRDLANSLGWKCTLMIWGGPLLALASLYLLLNITHLL